MVDEQTGGDDVGDTSVDVAKRRREPFLKFLDHFGGDLAKQSLAQQNPHQKHLRIVPDLRYRVVGDVVDATHQHFLEVGTPYARINRLGIEDQ